VSELFLAKTGGMSYLSMLRDFRIVGKMPIFPFL
jgi:hypothetical protein